ncbi:uncharacterized protein LOC110442873 [Mizuhopecten yessoensis]|uniref:uncharacterized protein LOC110442873 n=1 Tax=Mizuhopecten yessoensis TaxID=6573 RepID=UPI000B45B76C|nr:uncharacterized protein LOC110442873 [Mizuhopecten yessoensis]
MTTCYDGMKKWTVKKLKGWLEDHGLKKSGSKDVLVKRVFRAYQNLLDTDSSVIDSDLEMSQRMHTDFSKLDSSWTTVSNDNLPDISDKDIENYFLYQTNPTSGKRARFQRHLKKARKFCAENFLCDIAYHNVSVESEVCYVKAKCKPSIRNIVHVGNTGQTANLYSLNVCITKSTGHIMTAYCDCKAGEAGLCAHVGGLLFTLVKMKNACTSQECRWDRPRPIQRKPSPKRVHEVRFSTNVDTEKLRPYPDTFQASACNDPDIFLNDLLEGLEVVNPGCVLYKTLKSQPTDISSFLKIFEPTFSYADFVDLDSDECKTAFLEFFNKLNLNTDIIDNLEVGTRGQSLNKNWADARTVLITASNMGNVSKRKKTQPDNLVKTLRGYNPPPSTVKSLQHGRKYERQALKDYRKKHSKFCGGNVELDDRGLVVNPKFPYLGASVDSLVTCSKCGTGIVEVKCPYGSDSGGATKLLRRMSPLDCAKDPAFFCNLEDNDLKLKATHNYMYQIQHQMAICEQRANNLPRDSVPIVLERFQQLCEQIWTISARIQIAISSLLPRADARTRPRFINDVNPKARQINNPIRTIAEPQLHSPYSVCQERKDRTTTTQ